MSVLIVMENRASQYRRGRSGAAIDSMFAKVEQVEQVADGWSVAGHVRVVLFGRGIGIVIAAAVRDRWQAPVVLDEFKDGDVVAVVVGNMSATAVVGNHDQRDTRAIAKEIQVLDIAGVVVAAAFIHGDEDRGAFPKLWIGSYAVDDFLHEALEEIKLGGRWMAVNPAAGLDEGNRRQRAVLDVCV